MHTSPPPFRKLRGYAFDPLLSLKADTAGFNSITYKIPWEPLFPDECEKRKKEKKTEEAERLGTKDNYRMQGPGPVGEYIEVVDYDPTVGMSGQYYEPVDLNDPNILAQDGFAPSESNPLFHQQMAYAVAMTTIANFEKALGRKVLWAPRKLKDREKYQEYVQRLRIYPHALRDANAYYSPEKVALLFGYFTANPASSNLQMPGSLIFACLSHDIIAHETTHAILDGMHRFYNNPTNPDVLAFHEAFADIVALFQHFTFPEVLKKQIAETRGDLGAQNQLGKLAQEFGTAIGNYGSLRDAIGTTENGVWTPKQPSPDEYLTTTEPHDRGSILVAAVFEAFINIYKSRVADLLRIASNGTGILALGELHPDLVNRLAGEASKAAGHVLNMCIRALDYCPPVDITFGDYLRAIVTADSDLVEDDPLGYRLYFIDAFRRRGIYPKGIKTLSVESLRYTKHPAVSTQTQNLITIVTEYLRTYREKVGYLTEREHIYDVSQHYSGGGANGLHQRLTNKFQGSTEFEKLTGLVFSRNWELLGVPDSGARYNEGPAPAFQIINLRVVSRVGPDTNQINQIVFSVVQKSGIILKDGEFVEHYQPKTHTAPPPGGMVLRGGCTLIFDLDTLMLRYAISRPLVKHDSQGASVIDVERAISETNFQDGMLGLVDSRTYFGSDRNVFESEPFAFLHQH